MKKSKQSPKDKKATRLMSQNRTWQTALAKFRLAIFLSSLFLVATNAFTQTAQQNAARLRLAQDFERMGQYDRAAEIYATLFNADPRNGGYYAGLKRALQQLRRYDELVGVINRRLQMVDDVGTRVDLADVEFRRGQTAAAHAAWQELLQNIRMPERMARRQRADENRAYDEASQIYLQGREKLGIRRCSCWSSPICMQCARTRRHCRILAVFGRQSPAVSFRAKPDERDGAR
jgi:tetratricopeptide (TPR) repeat protein